MLDINYHPNTAQINVQGCIVLTHSYGKLNCDRLHNYYNYFHLHHYSLLTSTHKPVLARAPSGISKKSSARGFYRRKCIITCSYLQCIVGHRDRSTDDVIHRSHGRCDESVPLARHASFCLWSLRRLS